MVESWEKVDSDFCLRVEKERVVGAFNSHGDAICHLHLPVTVIDPVSLRQICQEGWCKESSEVILRLAQLPTCTYVRRRGEVGYNCSQCNRYRCVYIGKSETLEFKGRTDASTPISIDACRLYYNLQSHLHSSLPMY